MSFEPIHTKFGIHHCNMTYNGWYIYDVAMGNHSQIVDH